jgi:hypothetical protein
MLPHDDAEPLGTAVPVKNQCFLVPDGERQWQHSLAAINVGGDFGFQLFDLNL